VKLPLREPEFEALSAELAQWDGYVSGTLLAVEAIRACARYGEQYEREARDFLEGVSMLPLDIGVLDRAIALDPAQLRTLDALHLATALVVEAEIGVFVTYDQRLAETAATRGLTVISPS
jgi:predicted nucleic acid-binding protein